MKYLSLINSSDPDNEVIVSQVETDLTDDQAIKVDQFLRESGVLSEDLELAITED